MTPPHMGVQIPEGQDPAQAAPEIAIVRAFLRALEARDLARARALLAPGFAMTFPGGVRMQSLEELIAWAAPRYRFVKKSFERFETCGGGVVYCFGTLAGEWPDGRPFAGIRFIDRFELSEGRILRQDVWNDLAEVRLRQAAEAASGESSA